MEKPDIKELIERVNDSISKVGFDDRYACCWQGYFGALLEWKLISPDEHKKLCDMVPVEDPDPSLTIFLG